MLALVIVPSVKIAVDVPDCGPVAVSVNVTPMCCTPGEKLVSVKFPFPSALTFQTC